MLAKEVSEYTTDTESPTLCSVQVRAPHLDTSVQLDFHQEPSDW